VVETELLRRILDSVRDATTGQSRISRAWFTDAKFKGDASFECVEFGDIRPEWGGGAVFERAEFLGGASFRRAHFTGGAFFLQAKFLDSAQFGDAKFDGLAFFGSAKFTNGGLFAGSKFNDMAMFLGANFRWPVANSPQSHGSQTRATNGAWFDRVEFGGEAVFAEVTFGGWASFAETNFAMNAVFHSPELVGDGVSPDGIFPRSGHGFRVIENADSLAAMSFKSAHSQKRLTIGPLTIGGPHGVLDLDLVRAEGSVRVIATAKGVWCRSAEFLGPVRLSLRQAKVFLDNTVFTGPVTVESPGHPSTPAEPVQPDPALSSQASLRSVYDMDAEHLTLADLDLSFCELSGLRRPEQLRLDGNCTFATTPRGWVWHRGVPRCWTARDTLYEEHLWRRSVGAPAPGTGWAPPEERYPWGAEDEPGPTRIAVLYRQLRKALEDSKNEPGAADFYYGEMEMRRYAARQSGERWLLTNYWLISGYGQRGTRSLIALAGTILTAALALQYIGFHGPRPGYLDSLLYTAASVLSLNLTNGHVPDVLTDWGETVRILVRVTGPICLALAALAIRSRVKR
jgi:hypothetical protein